jgi:uncharacterized protein YjeT (DUF2065 family)
MALLPGFVVACALLVVAGLSKMRSPAGAQAALSLVRVSVPSAVIRAFGVGEVAVGVIAAVRPGALTGVLVAVTYGVFSGFVVVLLRSRTRPAGCGCFGDADSGAGAVHLALNVGACAVAVLAAVSPPGGIGWMLSRPPLTAVSLILGCAATALAAYLAYTAFPGAWRAYTSGARV